MISMLGLAEGQAQDGYRLQPISGADGVFQTVIIDGVTVYRSFATGDSYHRYMYFRCSEEIPQQTVYLEVTYKDIGYGRIGVQYNSRNTNYQMAETGYENYVLGTGRERTAVFELTNADFRNAQNLESDLRLWSDGSFAMHIVSASIYLEPTPLFLEKTPPDIAVTDPSLMGWWKFDEGSGTIAADASGRDMHGVLVNDPVWREDGVRKGCLFFDGDQAHVRITHQDSLNPAAGSFTVAFWAYLEPVPGSRGGKNWDLAVAKRDAGRAGYYIGADRNKGSADQSGYRFMLGDTDANRKDTVFVAVPLGEWVFVASVLDRDRNAQKISVDGGQTWASTKPPPGPIAPARDLGIGWDIGINNYWFHGRIDDVRLYNWPLSAKEILIVMEGGEGFPFAMRPVPEDGAMLEATWAKLSWMPGSFAISHDLYFGASFDDVNDGAERTFVGNLAMTSQVVGFPGFPAPEGLVPGTTYYWRVDEVNDLHPDSPWKGDVWSFMIPPEKAYNPDPADVSLHQDTWVNLRWFAGITAAWHDVYFGDNFDDVNDGAEGTFRGNQAKTFFIAGFPGFPYPDGLVPGTTYYWRIDEVNDTEPNSPWKGNVWSFSISPNAADAPAHFAITYYDNYNYDTGQWDAWQSDATPRDAWDDKYLADGSSGNTVYTDHAFTSITAFDLRGGLFSKDGHASGGEDWNPLQSIGDNVSGQSAHHVFAALFKGLIYLEEGDNLMVASDDDVYVFLGGDTAWGQEVLSIPSVSQFGTDSMTVTAAQEGYHTITVKYIERLNVHSGIEITLNEEHLQNAEVVIDIEPGSYPLSEALDTALSFTTGGSADWFYQTTTSYYEADAAQSGDISEDQESWMQTMVTGAGTVSFYWKVSSEEDYDFLEFYIDGSLQDQISGSVDWQQKTYTITTSDSHTLEWRYVKDKGTDSGSDCGWVDKLEWVPNWLAGPEEIVINIDKDFEYVPQGWPLGLSVGQTPAVGLSAEPYEALGKEPEYGSGQVLYGYIPLGNSNDPKISFAVDTSSINNWLLYVDTNNNEDLTDDGPPRENEGTGKLAALISLNVEVISASDEKIIRPYYLWFWITESELPLFYTRCHYRSQISIGEEQYTAIVYEYRNHDALYQESGLWIDLNRDGKLEGDKPEEHFQDGAVISINGKEYVLILNYP
ncbi:MAG: LamG domain-containing protein [Planctomycetota bacterium]